MESQTEAGNQDSASGSERVIDPTDLGNAASWWVWTLAIFVIIRACYASGAFNGLGRLAPVWWLGAFAPAGGFVDLGLIGVVPPLVLAVCLGVSLFFTRRATRGASEEVRVGVLGARVSFYLGIALVVETTPVFLVGAVASGSLYGPSKYWVDLASWLGLAAAAPILAGVLVSRLRFLGRLRGRPRRIALVAFVSATLGTVAIPLVAIVVDSSWSVTINGYPWTPPGFYIVMLGAGLEAAIAFLVAVLLPAFVLARPAHRPLVLAALGLGLATLALGVATFFVILGPHPVSPFEPTWWFVASFGFEGLPWGTWGLVPSLLGMASAVLLIITYGQTGRSLPRDEVGSAAGTAPSAGP